MNKDTVLKLTQELAVKMNEHFASADFQSQLKAIKEAKAEDTGSFRMVISTDDVDRHGEIVIQEGIETMNYMANPIVLWGHDSFSAPVGITEKLSLETINGKKQTVAEGKWAPTAFAQELRKLYEAKILNTASIGFIPHDFEGNKIMTSELLEWSFVSIPANPFASAVRSLGFKVSELVQKGVMELKEGETIETKENGDEEIKEPAADDLDKDKEGEEDDDTAEKTPEEIAAEETAKDKEGDDVEDIDGGVIPDSELSGIEHQEEGYVSLFFTDTAGKKKRLKLKTSLKAGRVLSKSNLEKVKSAITALEEIVKIAESSSEEDGKEHNASEGDEGGNGDKGVQDFLAIRKGLQGLATFTTDLLADAKERASKHHKVR